MFGALIFVDFLVKIFSISQVICNNLGIYIVSVFLFFYFIFCDTLAIYKCAWHKPHAIRRLDCSSTISYLHDYICKGLHGKGLPGKGLSSSWLYGGVVHTIKHFSSSWFPREIEFSVVQARLACHICLNI
jgi:hypothetical protein